MMLHFVPIDSQLWTQFVMDRISRQTDNYGKNNINLSQRGDGGGGGREGDLSTGHYGKTFQLLEGR